jgi:hypothetical protein
VSGAARGIRTPDLRITNAPLYQLSYCGFLSGYLQPACNRDAGDCSAEA